jgi:ubiquinone/menaquinone biosynthesis C-methylase UbiE
VKQSFRDSVGRLEREHWWYRARRRILERAVDRFAPAAARSLSIGIGSSAEAEMLAQRTTLFAVDVAEIDARCAAVSLPARADAVALPFSDASFDAVFLFDVLEHIENDAAALDEVRRVLRPRGALLITVPAFMFLYGRQDIVSEHKRRYTRRGLLELVRGHGFELRHATFFNGVLFLPIAAMRIARRLRRTAESGARSDFDVRLPRALESLLETAFALERFTIERRVMPFGVSLLCAARRANAGSGAPA